MSIFGGLAMAFLTYFFFLNWSVVKNFDATSALLKGDILALQLANPNLDSLKASQAQVLSQLYQEQETSALQFPSSKKAIAKAIEIANQVNQEIDLRYKSPSSSSQSPSSSSQSARQMTQERQQEAQSQQKLNSLLSSNTLNPSSSSADSSAAVPQNQKVTKPW
ncbi:MAG: hypothetical protein II818_04385 [Aeriscardovia sp.]|nr:hypothetical protein [Aeriscardovia sp.]